MRLALTIDSGSLANQRFELDSGFLTIGRTANCSVRFDPLHEKIASKQHAFIEGRDDEFFIIDNNSTNGTFVNGERIERARLSDGDVVQFGSGGITARVGISAAAPSPVPEEGRLQSPPVDIRKTFTSLGLGSVANAEKAESRTGQYVGAGIAIFIFVFLGLIVVGLLVASLGAFEIGLLGALIISTVAAVIAFVPAIFYLMPLVWLDRFDPEPLWILAAAFAWGAIVSVVVSFIINTTISLALGPVVGAVISAPIFEEASKGIGLLILLIFFRRYFDGILDGLIFAGVIALGFATVENVLYYGRALLGAGIPGVAVLFFIRGILSPFAHVTFTAMIGIGCGISRESHNMLVRVAAPMAGYCVAVFLHSLWNGVATFLGLGGFAILYILLEVPFFLIFVGFTIYIMVRQNRILKEMLAIDIAQGMIKQEHLDIATSPYRGFTWCIGGLAAGKFRARRKYIRAIGKLGLSYWHMQRATAAQGHTASFQQNPLLREQVLKWREEV